MIEVQILIPMRSNNGRPFRAAEHAAFEARASDLFGGVTKLPAAAEGAWIDAGRVYRDETRVYVVSIRSITDGAKVGRLARFARRHYNQKAVYIRYLGLSEIL